MSRTCVGVIGAGTMGVGVSVDLIFHDFDVVLVDRSEQVLHRAALEIVRLVRTAPMLRATLPRQSGDIRERLTPTLSLDELGTCAVIIENVTETWEAKREVYLGLGTVAPSVAWVGANTSCMSITQLGSQVPWPDKLVGFHLMNPSYLSSCVEVARGHHTSDTTIQGATGLADRLGKECIVVGDLPGFVANRISHLYMNEAAFVVQDGVATAKQIDDLFKRCYGHQMGPLETADLIGLDTVVHSLNVLYESYQDPKFRCCPLLRRMVHAGLLGRKSGRGFFEYGASGQISRTE